MNPTPHIVESAFMLLAAFAIGCLVGYVLRRLFGRASSEKSASKTAANSEIER